MLRLLESPESVDFQKVTLDDELTTIRIEVDGEGYGAFIPGEQLRTLWELQEAFYRLAAFALYETTDIRKLSPEERQLFELKVVTENGCWLGMHKSTISGLPISLSGLALFFVLNRSQRFI